MFKSLDEFSQVTLVNQVARSSEMIHVQTLCEFKPLFESAIIKTYSS